MTGDRPTRARTALLLRAVNVSGRNRVPMAELRTLLQPEFGEVTTYIASGNIIVDDPADPAASCARVRELIATAFDVDTPVIARSHAELVAALEAQPFGDGEDRFVHAVFLEADAAPDALAALEARRAPGERVALIGRELWIDYGEGVGRSKLTGAALDRVLGVAGTARNLRTVRELVELTA